ncbi:MAG: hypothetical protein WCG25_08670 [bacterium]
MQTILFSSIFTSFHIPLSNFLRPFVISFFVSIIFSLFCRQLFKNFQRSASQSLSSCAKFF